jgi:nitroreductase
MIIDAILKRHSVRAYKEDEVSKELLNEVIEAGRLAPSASNIQPWKFVIVEEKELRKELSKACNNQKFVAEAPVVIVGCIIVKGYSMGGSYDSAILDIGIALDHMTLQAASLGLGTCWIGAFNETEVKKLLQIPANVHVAVLLTLGFPKDSSMHNKCRKNVDEIVSYEKFS